MKKTILPLLVMFACVAMGIVDAVIQPGYVIKSLIKIVIFLCIPLLYRLFNKDFDIKRVLSPGKKDFLWLSVLELPYME